MFFPSRNQIRSPYTQVIAARQAEHIERVLQLRLNSITGIKTAQRIDEAEQRPACSRVSRERPRSGQYRF